MHYLGFMYADILSRLNIVEVDEAEDALAGRNVRELNCALVEFEPVEFEPVEFEQVDNEWKECKGNMCM